MYSLSKLGFDYDILVHSGIAQLACFGSLSHVVRFMESQRNSHREMLVTLNFKIVSNPTSGLARPFNNSRFLGSVLIGGEMFFLKMFFILKILK